MQYVHVGARSVLVGSLIFSLSGLQGAACAQPTVCEVRHFQHPSITVFEIDEAAPEELRILNDRVRELRESGDDSSAEYLATIELFGSAHDAWHWEKLGELSEELDIAVLDQRTRCIGVLHEILFNCSSIWLARIRASYPVSRPRHCVDHGQKVLALPVHEEMLSSLYDDFMQLRTYLPKAVEAQGFVTVDLIGALSFEEKMIILDRIMLDLGIMDARLEFVGKLAKEESEQKGPAHVLVEGLQFKITCLEKLAAIYSL